MNKGPIAVNKKRKDIPLIARSARRRGKLSVAIKLSSGADAVTPAKKIIVFGPIRPISVLIGIASGM